MPPAGEVRRRARDHRTALRGWVAFLGAVGVACGLPAEDPAAGAGAEDTADRAGNVETFVSLSDIHFDPFYDPTLFADLMATEATGWRGVFERSEVTALAPAGADSNFNLFTSALRAAGAADEAPAFVVISGDFLAHGFLKSFAAALAALPAEPPPAAGDCRAGTRPALECFIDRTIEFMALVLRDAFGEAPIYPVLGNNDSYCGDYEINPVGPFVRNTGATWSRLLIDEGNRASFDATFHDGGYFAADLAGSGSRLLALNTNIFSSHYRDACAVADAREQPPVGSTAAGGAAADTAPQGTDEPDSRRHVGIDAPEAAAAQLQWLREQLDAARQAGEGVLLMYHIPVGTDVYATLKAGHTDSAQDVVSYWTVPYTSSFLQMVAGNGAAIQGVLAGHTHMDQYFLMPRDEPADMSFQHITPAISPLFGNNPGFEVFTFDPDSAALLDYRAHYLDAVGTRSGRTPRWQVEYEFSGAYGPGAIAGPVLAEIWPRLEAPGPDRLKYERLYGVSNGSTTAFAGDRWKAYWCGIGTVTPADFVACVAR